MHRRMMFQKLSQIYGPLNEEVKQVNQEFLNMMINSNLISMDQELAGIANFLVHNINDYQRLKQFLFIVENSVRNLNLIEELKEIVYEIEIYQCGKINDRINEDIEKKLCLLY